MHFISLLKKKKKPAAMNKFMLMKQEKKTSRYVSRVNANEREKFVQRLKEMCFKFSLNF